MSQQHRRREVARQQPNSWVNDFRRLTRPNFVRLGDRILVVFNPRQAVEIERSYAGRTITAAEENTWNHEHFDFPVGRSHDDRFHGNYTLASSIRILWEEALASQHPGLAFTAIVIIEYELTLRGDDYSRFDERIVPTLRLWGADEGRVLESIYHPTEAGRERVFWPERAEEGLFAIDTIRRIIALPKGSPEKQQLIRRYYQEGE